MEHGFQEYIPEHDIVVEAPAKEILMNLAAAPAGHVHKNFTVLGILVHYVAGLLAFSAVSNACTFSDIIPRS